MRRGSATELQRENSASRGSGRVRSASMGGSSPLSSGRLPANAPPSGNVESPPPSAPPMPLPSAPPMPLPSAPPQHRRLSAGSGAPQRVVGRGRSASMPSSGSSVAPSLAQPPDSPRTLFQRGSDHPYQVMFGRGPAFSGQIRENTRNIADDLQRFRTRDDGQDSAGLRTLTALSQRNLQSVRGALGDLTEQETAFVQHWSQTRFDATHFTTDNVARHVESEDGSQLTMRSRKQLENRGDVPNAHHSPATVRARFRNEGFAYFSAEPHSENGFKGASRFGNNRYTVSAESPAFQNSMVTLVDQHVSTVRPWPSNRAMQSVGGYSQSQLSGYNGKMGQERVDHETMVYRTQDMGTAVGLHLLHSLRNLRDRKDIDWGGSFYQNALTTQDARGQNDLMNGFLDPQIMVPRMMATNQHRTARNPNTTSTAGTEDARGWVEPNSPNLPATPPGTPRAGPRDNPQLRDAAFEQFGLDRPQARVRSASVGSGSPMHNASALRRRSSTPPPPPMLGAAPPRPNPVAVGSGRGLPPPPANMVPPRARSASVPPPPRRNSGSGSDGGAD